MNGTSARKFCALPDLSTSLPEQKPSLQISDVWCVPSPCTKDVCLPPTTCGMQKSLTRPGPGKYFVARQINTHHARDKGIEPSGFNTWYGFQDRLSTVAHYLSWYERVASTLILLTLLAVQNEACVGEELNLRSSRYQRDALTPRPPTLDGATYQMAPSLCICRSDQGEASSAWDSNPHCTAFETVFSAIGIPEDVGKTTREHPISS